MPQTLGAATPTPGTAGSVPQGAGGASSSPAPGAAIVAVPVPAVPANGSSSQGLTAPAASPAPGNDPSGIGSGGPSASGSTLLGNAAASAVILPQMPTTTNNSFGTTSQVAQPNATSLVPIVSSTPGPAAAGTDPVPLVPTARQLNSAIGVANGLAANPGAAGAVLLPTPLAASSALPPIPSIKALNAGPDAEPIGVQPASGVLPTSLPEPGSFALFAVIAVASAIKMTVRRLRSRG